MMCLSGPLAAVNTTVLLGGSVSGEASAKPTLRNYSCTEACPVVMKIRQKSSTFIRPQIGRTQDDSEGHNEAHAKKRAGV